MDNQDTFNIAQTTPAAQNTKKAQFAYDLSQSGTLDAFLNTEDRLLNLGGISFNGNVYALDSNEAQDLINSFKKLPFSLRNIQNDYLDINYLSSAVAIDNQAVFNIAEINFDLQKWLWLNFDLAKPENFLREAQAVLTVRDTWREVLDKAQKAQAAISDTPETPDLDSLANSLALTPSASETDEALEQADSDVTDNELEQADDALDSDLSDNLDDDTLDLPDDTEDTGDANESEEPDESSELDETDDTEKPNETGDAEDSDEPEDSSASKESEDAEDDPDTNKTPDSSDDSKESDESDDIPDADESDDADQTGEPDETQGSADASSEQDDSKEPDDVQDDTPEPDEAGESTEPSDTPETQGTDDKPDEPDFLDDLESNHDGDDVRPVDVAAIKTEKPAPRVDLDSLDQDTVDNLVGETNNAPAIESPSQALLTKVTELLSRVLDNNMKQDVPSKDDTDQTKLSPLDKFKRDQDAQLASMIATNVN